MKTRTSSAVRLARSATEAKLKAQDELAETKQHIEKLETFLRNCGVSPNIFKVTELGFPPGVDPRDFKPAKGEFKVLIERHGYGLYAAPDVASAALVFVEDRWRELQRITPKARVRGTIRVWVWSAVHQEVVTVKQGGQTKPMPLFTVVS